MTSVKLMVNGAKVKAWVDGPLTSGTTGLPVTISYDRSWEGLTKTLVCRSSAGGLCDEVRTIINAGAKATVAHEVMIAGRTLYLGVEGRSPDETQVFPTIWAECGRIEPGANGSADPTAEATPEVWAQIMAQMGGLDGLDTDHKENLVAAINEAMTKGDGDPGRDGRGIVSVTGNEDGTWTFTYTDGAQETVSNEAYQAMVERVNQISEEIAGKMQLEPEFANSIEECTDTSKLYVLPDGYIYAYLMGKTTPNYTNQLPIATDTDGSVYNGKGYKENTRMSTSSFVPTAATGWCVTGFIPVKRGDTVRFKNMEFYDISGDGGSTSRCQFMFFDENFGHLINMGANPSSPYSSAWSPVYGDNGDVIQVTVPTSYNSTIRYMRITCGNLNGDSIITVNEEITVGEAIESWQNTDLAFVPADYENRIVAVETKASANAAGILAVADRVNALENANSGAEDGAGNGIPDYWKSHLEERVRDIRIALEAAGWNKSAFLWYSDAHWSSNKKISPALLKYLYSHTGINKTNFGGDIVSSENANLYEMDYIWEWRNAIRDLPNHHGVAGNHDDGNDADARWTFEAIYSHLLAAEETLDMVRGNRLYYYIDNPAENTRYLYLDTATKNGNVFYDEAQKAFIKQALIDTPNGWHIVAIAHIWLNVNYDVNPPVATGFSMGGQFCLDMFDSYNLRQGDFTNCGGHVEFCIGGHSHVDADYFTDTGIPVILTECDGTGVRGQYTCTAGTITENSVNAIIANYAQKKISVIRIGRGESREINY